MDAYPLVSTVIPAYNQGCYLKEAIESVLNQTYPNIEVVVVDDGSTDNSAVILKEMAEADPRIRAFHQLNQGFAAAMNRAVNESKGEYIAHLDSDDIMEPQKIQTQMEFLQNHPEVDLVHTAVQVIDSKGRPLLIFRGEDVDGETFLAKMFERSIMGNPTTIFGRRECWVNVPFLEKYKRSVDYERVLRLARKYRFQYIDLPLTKWRRHQENLTNDLEPYRLEQLDIWRSYQIEEIFGCVDRAHLSDGEKQLLKGRIYYNLEDYDKAAEQFRLLHSSSSFFSLGNCQMKRGDAKGAIQSYKKSLELDSRNPACLNNLGVALRQNGQREEASLLFKQAMELQPDYLDAKYNASHHDSLLTERELRKNLIPYQFSNP